VTVVLTGPLLLALVACLAPLLVRYARAAAAAVLATVPLALFLYLASLVPDVAAGPLRASVPWVPSLGVAFAARLDGLSLLFALLITGIGTLIVLYAGAYLKGHPQLGRFYLTLLLFMAAMLGLVLADDLLYLFVCWELTSITSYLLIGFNHESPTARRAALQALLVTGVGGLVMLAGFLLLGGAGGTWQVGALVADPDLARHPVALWALVLIAFGAFTKSAQWPWHFWLPGAMEAPTPVSAYLHSATMVKAGVYLLARVHPLFADLPLWHALVGGVGALTMVWAAWLTVTQTDLKRILAYSTVSALGTLVLLLGLGDAETALAAGIFILAHALYKGALFMVAGTIDHETGTRDVRQLGGLRAALPWTAAGGVVAAVSMAGVLPTFGFVSKEILYEGLLHVPQVGVPALAATVLSSALFVAVALRTGVAPFFIGRPRDLPKAHPHEAPIGMWIGPMALGVLGLALGVGSAFVAPTFLLPIAAAINGAPVEASVALWHGFTPVLGLSVLTLALGVGLFMARTPLLALKRPSWQWLTWAHAYGRGLWLLDATSARVTRTLQHGRLAGYLRVVLVVTIAAVVAALWRAAPAWRPAVVTMPHGVEVFAVLVALVASVATMFARSSLHAVLALGITGYSVALTFVLFGAPDLAMTQFLIESLSVILFVFVFFHLPDYSPLERRRGRLRDLILAGAFGLVVTGLVLVALSNRVDSALAPYFIANAKPLGHGGNIVNVILVDFRGIDTFGEITVLAAAGIGVFALLRGRRERGRT
jgi:multicomponent Na+:H+ antiporter subunit A